MQTFLVVICCVIILSLCIMGAFGFWYFVNSDAAEAQAWELTNSLSGVVDSIGTGLLVILVGVGIGGFLWLTGLGIKNGAEPMARAVGTYLLSKEATQLMLPGSGIDTPNMKVWPPIDQGAQVQIPEIDREGFPRLTSGL